MDNKKEFNYNGYLVRFEDAQYCEFLGDYTLAMWCCYNLLDGSLGETSEDKQEVLNWIDAA